MIRLDDYGKVLRRYLGHGEVNLNGTSYQCSFECVQYSDARIRIACRDICLTGSEGFAPFFGGPEESSDVKLVGVTDGGDDVEASDCLVLHSTIALHTKCGVEDSSCLCLSCSSLKVSARVQVVPAEVRFSVANLEFLDTEIEFVENPDGTRRWRSSHFPVDLGVRRIRLRRVEGYDQVVRNLKATRGVDVTCQAVVRVDAMEEADEVIGMVEEVCALLTLARGTLIQWISYDVVSDSGSLMSIHCGNRVTKNYSILSLIPLIDEQQGKLVTSQFVRSAYPRLAEAEENWQIRRAIDSYTDAKTEHDFLEARALKMVVCMEFLRGRYLARHDKVTILPCDAFEGLVGQIKSQLRPMLEQAARSALGEQTTADNAVEMMLNHVRGMNYYPFGRALGEMCKEVGLVVNSEDRHKFKEIRDSLVHYERFPKGYGTPIDQYFFLNDFVGRFLLALLDYHLPP